MRKIFDAILSAYCKAGDYVFLPAKLFVEFMDKLTNKK